MNAFTRWFNQILHNKPAQPLIVNPGDIEYCPIKCEITPSKTFIKQPCRTVYPPTPASFNEVFSNVSNQLNARVRV